ncbi:acyl-CoA synthetase [Arenibaculum pallidiluteum]|uniref:acyl-CoA synthetase n=1 Tax=Arenibaculum pallidiluteum TaxID=2812559 RepID=UPI001A97742F|nr:acyl-CoA synthetase [Arenibaculum pallidiluteum]
MLERHGSYEETARRFAWRVPARYNIGVDVCDRHAHDAGRIALLWEEDGRLRTFSFAEIRALSNRLANLLGAHGIARGDRLAVLLPQCPETALAHVAGFKAGLITVPLFALFGEEALEYRLADSGARVLVTDTAGWAKVAPLRARLPNLCLVLCTDGGPAGTTDLHRALERASDRFDPVDTAADDPAVIIYTSGTTGNPKGALHAHRVLPGHLPGVELPHEFFPQPGDLFWTPADWAWIGGLFDVLMPAWHHGIPVLAKRFAKFDPERAVDLMARHGVRNVFLPPTALKLIRQAGVAGTGLRLRTLASGGETLGGELQDWGRSVLGLPINEFYGQTECNLVVGNAAGLMPIRPGSMGRAIPGHRVGIVDAEGNELPDGTVGSIAVRRPDPVMFLGYWNKPEATAAKFAGDWLVTGDLGRRDPDGYLWYVGRDDDVITSGGYRIGPGEVEECLMRHPAVALAAVVGVPDPIRTEIVKAYVVLRKGHAPSPALASEIQDFVRTRLAAHEYPRQVAFVDELPMTTTGKIMRRVLRQQAAAGEA